jgi:hypothetical protein
MSYEEEDACSDRRVQGVAMSYEEEDACNDRRVQGVAVSYEEEDACNDRRVQGVAMPYEEEDACNDRRVQGVAHKHRFRITTRISSAIFDGWRGWCCRGVSTPRATSLTESYYLLPTGRGREGEEGSRRVSLGDFFWRMRC